MEVNKILTADLLDIIFEGRNKEYGAYDLRKSYNRRLSVSIAGMLTLIALLFLGYAWASSREPDKVAEQLDIPDTRLVDVSVPDEPPPPVIPPPPAAAPPPQTQTIQYTVPRIEDDDKVRPDEQPPAMTEMEDVRIGTVNQEGVKDMGIVAPPIQDHGEGVISGPPARPSKDSLFLKVEIESKYPGGTDAWVRFLKKSFRYPQYAIDNEIQGTVVVQFIVDADGNVSSVQAISGPKELWEEAERVIRKSGKWDPALQNGNYVKSYKRQPIVCSLGL